MSFNDVVMFIMALGIIIGAIDKIIGNNKERIIKRLKNNNIEILKTDISLRMTIIIHLSFVILKQ